MSHKNDFQVLLKLIFLSSTYRKQMCFHGESLFIFGIAFIDFSPSGVETGQKITPLRLNAIFVFCIPFLYFQT